MVTGDPLSSYVVLTPTGTVAVVGNPCWLYPVIVLYSQSEEPAAGETAGDDVDEADWDIDCETVSMSGLFEVFALEGAYSQGPSWVEPPCPWLD